MKPTAISASRRLQTYLTQTVRLLVGLICISIALPFAVLAQTNAPAPLPPAAQEAVNKGIIAAKVPDYLLAIRYFEDARKIVPQAPVIYLNMGLAESRIPGRELRAIAWFGAYLAAYPDASNTAAVKEQISVLEVRNQNNTARLLKAVQDAAIQKLPNPLKGSYYGPGEQNDVFLYDAAKLWIETGDIAAALKIVNLFHDAYPESMFSSKSHALRDISIVQARNGDIDAAKKNANLIRDERGKNQALQIIAIEQAERGDFAGAKKTGELIKANWERGWAQSAIAKTQAKSGDSTGAKITFLESLKFAYLVSYAEPKIRLQVKIAEAQIDAGYIPEAQRTLAEAQKNARELTGEEKKDAEKNIADALARLGVASAATQALPTVNQKVAVIIAADWIKMLDNDNKNSDYPLNTEPFLDLAGYLKFMTDHLKSKPELDTPEMFFKALHDTAQKIVGSQNVIHQMLKQEVKK